VTLSGVRKSIQSAVGFLAHSQKIGVKSQDVIAGSGHNLRSYGNGWMPGLIIKAMCACGFTKEWKSVVASGPFLEEMDAVSLEILKEGMKTEPHGPHDCPKCQLRSLRYWESYVIRKRH
jgi:hypothetical protein